MTLDPDKLEVGDEFEGLAGKIEDTTATRVLVRWTNGEANYLGRAALAQATLLPRPIKVGDRVTGGGWLVGLTVIGLDGDWAWLRDDDGDRSHRRVDHLRHAGPEAPQ